MVLDSMIYTTQLTGLYVTASSYLACHAALPKDRTGARRLFVPVPASIMWYFGIALSGLASFSRDPGTEQTNG